MFFYVRARFRFAPIDKNLTAQSTGSHRELEAEFKFQGRSCNLCLLFPPLRQIARRLALKGLVFSVTPFKIDQNKNQNRSIVKVQNLGNERRYIYKDPRQDSGQRNISYTRYPEEIEFCMETPCWCSPGWAPTLVANGNQQKHLLLSFAKKVWIYSSRNA